MGDQEPSGASKEFWVCLSRDVIAVPIINDVQFLIKQSASLGLFIHVFLPSLKNSVGLVSKVDVFASDTAIKLCNTMFVEATSGADGVWNPRISPANGVFTRDKIIAS